MDYLACPIDPSASLDLRIDSIVNESIETGAISCTECQRHFPIYSGIPDFLLHDPGDDDSIRLLKKREIDKRDAQAAEYESLFSPYIVSLEPTAVLAYFQVAADDVVLDVGCGTGRITRLYRPRTKLVIGVDYSMRSLQLLRQLDDSIPVVRADACALPFRRNLFTKCLSSQVIEHIPSEVERHRAIQSIYDCLQPSGVIVMTMYNNSVWMRLRRRFSDDPRARKEGFHSGGQIYYFQFDSSEARAIYEPLFHVERLAGILNLAYQNMGAMLGQWGARLDRLIERTPLSLITGKLLLIKASKLPD